LNACAAAEENQICGIDKTCLFKRRMVRACEGYFPGRIFRGELIRKLTVTGLPTTSGR
jgi:hypothetical protein